MDSQDSRIPVTLLTGFLGAGKTTLLNTLLRDPDAGRIAVIVNEFGDVGLDHDLIEASTEELVLLPSGCLCCTVREDLLKTLQLLFARRDDGALAFDRVVIETTGIADPAPILHSFIVDQAANARFRMDGVVTVADAKTGPRTLTTNGEAVNQIAMADLIVLSKTNMVSKTELARFEAQIDGINKTARRIHADHGRVPPGALFGLSALRTNVSDADLSQWLGTVVSKTDPLAGLSGFAVQTGGPAPLRFSQTGPTPHHNHRISSASVELHDPIPANQFDFWLETLIALKGPDILRIKGIVHVEGIDWPFVFHGVQHIFDAPVPLEGWTGTKTTSRVVIIAKDMTTEDLTASLSTLRSRPADGHGQHSDGVIHTTELETSAI